jgi:hypothetical protein
MAAGAAAMLPARAIAAPCVSGPLPAFLPTMLTVDCASRRNFQLFRQNSGHLGLAGAVNMTFVRGKLGSYEAGNLFLFPWLKPKGQAMGAAKVWNSVVPTSATAFRAASPIPGSTLPLDEYFCNFVLQAAPLSAFIGFAVDVPYAKLEAKLGLYSNIDKLADGKPVGDRQIPATAACNGNAWRQLIANGLNLASRLAC